MDAAPCPRLPAMTLAPSLFSLLSDGAGQAVLSNNVQFTLREGNLCPKLGMPFLHSKLSNGNRHIRMNTTINHRWIGRYFNQLDNGRRM